MTSFFLKNWNFFVKFDSFVPSAGTKTVKLEVRAAELAIVVHRPDSGDFLAAEEVALDSVSSF